MVISKESRLVGTLNTLPKKPVDIIQTPAIPYGEVRSRYSHRLTRIIL